MNDSKAFSWSVDHFIASRAIQDLTLGIQIPSRWMVSSQGSKMLPRAARFDVGKWAVLFSCLLELATAADLFKPRRMQADFESKFSEFESKCVSLLGTLSQQLEESCCAGSCASIPTRCPPKCAELWEPFAAKCSTFLEVSCIPNMPNFAQHLHFDTVLCRSFLRVSCVSCA